MEEKNYINIGVEKIVKWNREWAVQSLYEKVCTKLKENKK